MPLGDVEAMGQTACELLKNPEAHQRVRAAARKRSEYFSQSNIIDRYERLYRRVLSASLQENTIATTS